VSEVNIPVTISKSSAQADGASGNAPAKSCGSHCGCGDTSTIPGMPLSPLQQAQARTQALAAERKKLVERGMVLQYVTIAYTSIEAIIALVSGAACGSIALVGFGLDSAIEVTSGLASLFRLKADGKKDLHKKAEQLSLQITGWCFLALSAYVGYEALSVLWKHEAPERSVPGLILAAVSVLFMPWLAGQKKAVAKNLGSFALETDSKQALFCSYLSAILLVGLVLNASFGWWWADSVAALIMVPVMAREGLLALKGKSCCGGVCD
jgi:divalent metal cation (Fe/Co/Zn/Cd) transporter